MKNQEVADVLYTIADLLDIKGEGFFVTRAYRMAAATIETLDENINTLVKQHRLQHIQGIGKALEQKITELVETEKLEYLQRLKQEIPIELLEFLKIPNLGPKKVAAIYTHLGITSITDLKQAVQEGKLRDLDGFGEITERNILRGIKLREQTSGRFLLHHAYEDGQRYLKYLKTCEHIQHISLAGSLRRMKESIGDLDILACSEHPEKVMDFFVKYSDVDRILLKGSTKTSVLLNDHMQVDLRVVEEKSFGSALQYFTGSKEHNVSMRSLAIKKGYKLNEYGVFDKETENYIVGKQEQDIYKTLNLAYIPPELRENRGEIEAAQKNRLPYLIKQEDINGDFHVHSELSDGTDSIETIVKSAQQRGYKFIGITDHSETLYLAQGLSAERVHKKRAHIQKLNKKYPDIQIFCGTECDILADGSLDYADDILKLFDFVYLGVHRAFKMTGKEMTQRLIKAMEHKNAHFLAHPTCRLIGKREPFDLDMDLIFETAKNNNIFLEINAFPDRLDLKDIHVKQAKDAGVKLVIGTDAHSITSLPFMQYGVATARRGWLEKQHVLNTYSVQKIEHILKEKP